jgi:hypothetical protein
VFKPGFWKWCITLRITVFSESCYQLGLNTCYMIRKLRCGCQFPWCSLCLGVQEIWLPIQPRLQSLHHMTIQWASYEPLLARNGHTARSRRQAQARACVWSQKCDHRPSHAEARDISNTLTAAFSIYNSQNEINAKNYTRYVTWMLQQSLCIPNIPYRFLEPQNRWRQVCYGSTVYVEVWIRGISYMKITTG